MESEARYFLVGLFVIAATLLLVGTVFWLSKNSAGGNLKYYSAYFKHQTLDGLQRDSYVTMKGVRVGSVADYRISPANIEEVKVIMRIEAGTPVKEDTRAKIKRNLLTGLAVVELTGSTQDSPLLVAPPPGEPYPVIAEGRSELDKLADSLPDLLQKATGIVNRMNAALSEENLHALSGSLKNVEDFTASLAGNREAINSALAEIQKTSKAVADASSAIAAFANSSNNRVSDVSRETAEMLRQLKQNLEDLNKRTAEITTSVRSSSDVFSQQIAAMSQSIGDAARSFSKTVESFEDPASLLGGPREKSLGPGEKSEK